MRAFIFKFTAALLTASYLMFAPVPLLDYDKQPLMHQAEAEVPTFSPIEYALQGLEYIESTLIAANTSLEAATGISLLSKEFTLDFLAWEIAKMALKSITRSTVNWINSGFQGSPSFVQNFETFMLGVADEYVNEHIYGTYLDFLCQPFQLDIRIALELQYGANRGSSQPRCTLSGIEDNIENFVNGTFEEGGWQRMLEISANPKNTPYGAYLDAQGKIQAGIRTAQGNSRLEQEVGNGFLSFALCDPIESEDGTSKDNTGKPGAASKDDCLITKPGQFIAAQINEVASYEGKALIEADEINEIIGALFTQLATRAITNASGLLGLSARGYDKGQGSFIDAWEREPIRPQITDPAAASSLEDDITRHQEYVTLFTRVQPPITTRVQTIQTRITEARSDYPGCFNLTFANNWPRILPIRDRALNATNQVPGLIVQMQTLQTALDTPNITAQDKISLLNQTSAIRNNDAYVSLSESGQALGFIGIYEEWNRTVDSQINQTITACETTGQPPTNLVI